MPGRILIVDDILPNIKLLEAKLSGEYYDVITAENGYRALELTKTESPDIILLDVMMPGLDGFQVCEKLKSDPLTAHIPVIIVTALSDVADRVRGLEAGADDFLSKPVRDTPLFARVRSLIRLKSLMDAWRMREETSSRLGFLAPTPLLGQMDATCGRILVVEESAIDAANLIEALAPDRHEVSVCSFLAEGFQRIQEEGFDLVVVSMEIQNGDTLRFCSQVRSQVQERIRFMPILLLAENDEELGRIAKGLDLGVNDYVLKPVDRHELLVRVRTQIRRQRFQNRLRINYEESIALASTDPLTGVFNRRYLDMHLDRILERSHKTKKSLAILFCDIDHFKKLNDTYGHTVGDEILIAFGQRLQSHLRNLDLVARIGGEEFVVVMPDMLGEQAVKIAERLRAKIKEEAFTVTGIDPLHITISIGITTIGANDTVGVDMLRRADEAMYLAKNGGRNRVVQAIADDRGKAPTFVQFPPD